MDENKKKKVLCPITKDNKTYWMRLGVAFVNKDNSLNLYLDGLPTNGKLHVRDWDDGPHERRSGGWNGSAVSGGMREEPTFAPQPQQQEDIPF
ncbi:MAG TPA: hypothetical protein VKE22_02305 [Haliangiales bacterium]|nr:hypothetical protein [Haliangiales bacterium]